MAQRIERRFLDLRSRKLTSDERVKLSQLKRPVVAKRIICNHYDLDGRLYELFLDSDQQYSCAYFETPEASLEDAQLAKKRHLAAKLALEPGQTVLDIGSGWGGLGLYIARHSNAYVQGVTLSEEQLAVSRSRAEKEGLRHKVQFDLQDYRSLETRFDRIVSVGMFEHVGRKSYDEFFSKVHDLLADDGVALLHYIGRTTRPFQTNEWILKYIFPGGYMPSEGVLANMVVGEDFAAISTAGFSRRDLLDRAVVIDRVASDGSAFAARRDAAETFWSAGMPCNREVSRVLDGLLVPVSVEQAVAAAVEITTGYGSFQARPQIEHPVQSALIGQALARVYENGFAFVSVPAGAGLTEIQDELQRRMANNAARMIGNGAPPHGCWDAHVETATGGNWPEDRISSILGSQAPLALDGSIAPIGNETLLRAAHRRMSCRYRMRGAPGSSDFSGFPEIRRDIIELPATKGQLASYTRVIEDPARLRSRGAGQGHARPGRVGLASIAISDGAGPEAKRAATWPPLLFLVASTSPPRPRRGRWARPG